MLRVRSLSLSALLCDARWMRKAIRPVEISEPRVIELFDELPLWSAPFTQVLLDRVPLLRNSTVLDVGAGTGLLTLELAQRCGPSTQVIAVDPWTAAVERLRRKVALLELENVEVIEGPAEDLDLAAASVDLVVCNLGLNNFDNPAAVLTACRRLAKPGGALVLTTNLVGHMDELYEELCEALIGRGLSACLPALEAHRLHRGTMRSITELLENSGFEVCETLEDSFRLRYVDGTTFLNHYFIRLGFLEAWQGLIPDAQSDAVLAALEERLNQRAESLGELVMTIPMAYVEAKASIGIG